MPASTNAYEKLPWFGEDGKPIACVEKLKVLTENALELHQVAQDAFEDALLMGCSEQQIRQRLSAIISSLENPYKRL